MLRMVARKFAAVIALVGLLLPVASTLAGAIAAADLPVCCNTNYCPLHHNSGNSQKSDPDCPGKNMPGQESSTVRACDSAPNLIVGTALFVLVAPMALRAPAATETAVAFVFVSAASFASIPVTPPPRAIQS